MDDERKTKAQLIDELLGLRRRINTLKAFETERAEIQTELSGTRQRLQYLLAVSPAIIYTTHASGDYACTFVSENLHAIMGYSAEEMTTDPKCWPDRLHPEDAPRVFEEMAPLIGSDAVLVMSAVGRRWFLERNQRHGSDSPADGARPVRLRRGRGR